MYIINIVDLRLGFGLNVTRCLKLHRVATLSDVTAGWLRKWLLDYNGHSKEGVSTLLLDLGDGILHPLPRFLFI